MQLISACIAGLCSSVASRAAENPTVLRGSYANDVGTVTGVER